MDVCVYHSQFSRLGASKNWRSDRHKGRSRLPRSRIQPCLLLEVTLNILKPRLALCGKWTPLHTKLHADTGCSMNCLQPRNSTSIYVGDLVACLPDLRHEDVRLCLGAGSCHLSIRFLSAHRLSVTPTLLYLYLSYVRLCFGVRSCHLSIHRPSPIAHRLFFMFALRYSHACDSVTYPFPPPDLRHEVSGSNLGQLLFIHSSPTTPATIHLPTFQ